MSRLPVPHEDVGIWGDILNDYVLVEHNPDGTHRVVVNPDATATSKGKIQLTGDLGGTAAAPSVPGLATKADDNNVAHRTGNENISGVKTFSSSPVVPAPTSPTDAATKSYVDAAASAGAPDATSTNKGIIQLAGDLSGTAVAPTVPGLATKANDSAVAHLTGSELISGVKTFSSSPVVPAPISPTDAVNKAYTDAAVASTGSPDATINSRGIIQLAGDLGGIAAAPTVLGLAGKYTLPGTGIPKSDLEANVQASLTKADSALQSAPVTSVAGKVGIVTLAEGDIANLTSDLMAKEATANRGAAGGYAPLDGSAKVPTANLPAGLALEVPTAPPNTNITGGVVGASSTAAHSDHTHKIGSHASTHATAGSDPVSTASIGATSTTGGGKEATSTNPASGATPTINLTNGNVQMVTLTANATFTFSGATNSVACSFSLYLQQDGTGGRAVIWPTSVKWPSAIAPSLSNAANKIDLLIFESLDGGTTWFGSLAGADYR